MENKLTNLNIFERNFIFGFKRFKAEIFSNTERMFEEEDIYGGSYKFKEIWLFHIINMFGMLMKLRLNEWKDFERLKSSFDFEKIRKSLACKYINLQDILEEYNIKDDTLNGISKVKINQTFKIGDEHYDDSFKENLDYYLDLQDECKLFLNAQNRGLATDINIGLEIQTQTLLQV